MKHIFSLLLVVSLFVFSSGAQITITQWDFNSLTPGNLPSVTPSTGTGVVSLFGGVTTPTSGSAGLGSSDLASTNLALQTTTYPAQSQGNLTAGAQFSTSTVGYQNLKFIFDLRLSNTASRWIQIQYTLNGSLWTNFASPIRVGGLGDDNAGDQWLNQIVTNFTSITGANNNPNFGVRVVSSFSSNAFTMYNTGSMYAVNQAYESARNPSVGVNSDYASTGTMRFDMVTFEGALLAPTIAATPNTLTSFSQTIGSPSATQSFSASATNLTGNLTISAPTNYQVSLSSGSGFQSSLLITPTNGQVASTTIYVRLNASVADSYSGNITLSSPGASNQLVALSGIASNVPLPFIIPSPTSLSGFAQIIGTPSSEQVLSVSGGNLTSNVTISAPTGYQVSLTSGTGFTNTVTLNQSAGTVNATSVYVRLNHTVIGSLLANLTLSATGVTNVLVPLSGSVAQPAQPLLAVTPLSLDDFYQNLGYPSANQLISVGGQNLTSNVSITTNSNYFISTSSTGPFSQSIVLTPIGGFLDPTQIFVQLSATSAGISNGVLTVSTTGATNVVITLNGESVQPMGALLYYWHFNTLVTPVDVTTIDADYSLIPGVTGKFDYTNPVTGQRDMDMFDTGSLINSQMGEGAGTAVRVRNPSTDRTLDFFVPTTNATGIRFAYTVQRSGQGMLENIVSYSLNGLDFITTNLANNTVLVTEAYEFYSYDFSGIIGANNNPNFRIRISFNGNTVAITGNNRFDNFTLTANTILDIEENANLLASVYPNPVQDLVQVTSPLEIQSVQLVDLHGRVLLITNDSSISMSNFQSGLYFLRIQTGQGIIEKQVIKK